MAQTFAQAIAEFQTLVEKWADAATKAGQQSVEDIIRTSNAFSPTVAKGFDAMMADALLARGARDALELASDVKAGANVDNAVKQSAVASIDARLAAQDKASAAFAEAVKAFETAAKLAKEHAVAARAALTGSGPSGGGGNGGGGSSGGKPAGDKSPPANPSPSPSPAQPAPGTGKAAPDAGKPDAAKSAQGDGAPDPTPKAGGGFFRRS